MSLVAFGGHQKNGGREKKSLASTVKPVMGLMGPPEVDTGISGVVT